MVFYINTFVLVLGEYRQMFIDEIVMLLTRLSSQVDFPWSLPINQRFTLVSEFSAVSGCSETLKSLFTRWVQILLCFCILFQEKSRTYLNIEKWSIITMLLLFFRVRFASKKKASWEKSFNVFFGPFEMPSWVFSFDMVFIHVLWI